MDRQYNNGLFASLPPMAMSSSKKAKTTHDQERPVPTKRERFEAHLATLGMVRPTSELFTQIYTNNRWSQFNMLADVDVSDLPAHYLPEPFERGMRPDGKPVILFEGTALSQESMARLHALIRASSRGSREVYMDNNFSALIVPRSRAVEGKQLFDSQTFAFPAKPPYALLQRIATLLGGTSPSTTNCLALLAAAKASLKLPETVDVIEKLPVSFDDEKLFGNLTPLLSSDVSVLRDISAALIAEFANEDNVASLLQTAEEGKLPGDTLYSILRGSLALPVLRFKDTMGLDQHGLPVKQKKLSECKEEDDIAVSTSIVAKNYFFQLSDASEVFVVPASGLHRKAGGSKAKPNIASMDQPVKKAGFFKRLVRAIRGSQGIPQRARANESVPPAIPVATEEEEL